jgi:hypothetical protein
MTARRFLLCGFAAILQLATVEAHDVIAAIGLCKST